LSQGSRVPSACPVEAQLCCLVVNSFLCYLVLFVNVMIGFLQNVFLYISAD